MPIDYKQKMSLRCGWTTGSCAAAAAQAAACLLLTGQAPASVVLQTPKGITLTLPVETADRKADTAVCAVRKDAGDDPDVTNGILIAALVQKTEKPGIFITGGEGVGRVTKPGLACPVGEAAINPGPRAQITRAVRLAMQNAAYQGGLLVTISAQNGAAIARQTLNSQLGIEGGISILGTSGIVEPMSEQALLDTIHVALDAVYAQGQRVALLCPGNYGADFIRDTLRLDVKQAVKCSNYIGDALDWAVYRGFPAILLVGHAGKLIKLAAGVMNTHSSIADGRQEILTAHAALCGAPLSLLEALMETVSVDAGITLLGELRAPVLHRIGQKMTEALRRRVRNQIPVEFIMFTQQYGILVQSTGAEAVCDGLRERTDKS